MWLSTRENRGLNEEEDMWNEIWQHQQIYNIFLRHNLKQHTVSINEICNTLCNSMAYAACRCLKSASSYSQNSEWNGQLPEAANAILQQHAIQGDLTELQV